MDPLSIAASVFALAQCTSLLISFTKTCINAKEERKKFIEELRKVSNMAQQLDDRYQASNKEDPWYRGMRKMGETCGRLTEEGKYTPPPDSTKETTGPLDKLFMIISEMYSELHDAQASHRLQRGYERLKWFWDKDKFANRLVEIEKTSVVVFRIMDLDHFEASKAAAISSRETAEGVTDIRIRLKAIEDNSIEQRKKEKEEEDEREKETMMKWLSPTLDFLARQKDLYENCFRSAGQWLLDHDVFQQWTHGQSWYLRCLGEPGAGKVGVFEPITSSSRFLMRFPDNAIVDLSKPSARAI